MNAWATPGDIRSYLQKRWDNGQILAAVVHGESLFPLRMPLKHPGATAMGDQFDAVRQWIAALSGHCKGETGLGFDLEWRHINHRQLGKNRLPVAAVLESELDALSIIGKQKQAEQFKTLANSTIIAFPALKDWLGKKPMKALKHAHDWPHLLAVLKWISQHPHPNIYLRQIDLANVHSKFIEAHKGLLIELLDRVLPDDAINSEATGVKGFERRYGFRSKPAQIRFRLVDPKLGIDGLTDLAVPAEEFARLQTCVKTVFITENDINGLAFPYVADSMVIFGLGYGLQTLSEIDWLKSKKIMYWGDIDTHGFAMLDQVRQYFPNTKSLLMDTATLLAHERLWGEENKPTSRDLHHLEPHEMDLYQEIINNRYKNRLRLEQERIGYSRLKAALSRI